MVSVSLVLSGLALLASQAAAHGGVGKYIIGGTDWKGYESLFKTKMPKMEN